MSFSGKEFQEMLKKSSRTKVRATSEEMEGVFRSRDGGIRPRLRL
jgi:hypothetical protein